MAVKHEILGYLIRQTNPRVLLFGSWILNMTWADGCRGLIEDDPQLVMVVVLLVISGDVEMGHVNAFWTEQKSSRVGVEQKSASKLQTGDWESKHGLNHLNYGLRWIWTVVFAGGKGTIVMTYGYRLCFKRLRCLSWWFEIGTSTIDQMVRLSGFFMRSHNDIAGCLAISKSMQKSKVASISYLYIIYNYIVFPRKYLCIIYTYYTRNFPLPRLIIGHTD